jgi:hypothetical protein
VASSEKSFGFCRSEQVLFDYVPAPGMGKVKGVVKVRRRDGDAFQRPPKYASKWFSTCSVRTTLRLRSRFAIWSKLLQAFR